MARHRALAFGLLCLGACAPEQRSSTASATLCQVAPQPVSDGTQFTALIEIPRGGRVKYEFDASTGRLRADRVLAGSLAYPANYGALPCTLAGDGDPLDFLLLGADAFEPGTLVEVRPIGVMRMRDRGASDDKIIAVVLGDTLLSVPPDVQLVISTFFQTYKAPAADQQVGPWADADTARAIVREAIAAAQRH
jgi:inorganic pyrophosphatase